MVEELSREEKRALRKAEKRKAKFGEDAPDGGPSAATSSKTVAKTAATPSDTPISIDSTKVAANGREARIVSLNTNVVYPYRRRRSPRRGHMMAPK